MQVEVLAGKLAKALNIVSRVAGGFRNNLAILNNVLIRADKGVLSLIATNLEVATIDNIPAKVKKDGTITVPAKLLAEFISNLPKDENVEIKVEGNKLIASSGKYQANINGILADDFPELPSVDEKEAIIFSIPTDIFKASLSEIIVASSNDTTRPILTGVYFNTFENDLYLAATDGYRLAEKKFVADVKSELKAVVPTIALQETIRSIDEEESEVEIFFNEDQVKLKIGEVEIISNLIQGSFPDYRQLIPKNTEIEMEMDKAELVRVVKLAALFAKDLGGSIVCETDSEKQVFRVGAVASELGENSSEIEVKVSESGKITLNSKFLIDALNGTVEKNVNFGFSGKLAPVVIRNKKNKDYTHIVMPLKG
jgi:DNA polymerase-3 subunit beta